MNWMVYRILPCVLMLVLAATPVARTICDISCSEHHDTSTSFPHSHHHHGDSTATSGAHLSPVAHLCNPSDEWRTSPAPKHVVAAPAVVTQSCDIVRTLDATLTSKSNPFIRDVIPLSLRTPLRI